MRTRALIAAVAVSLLVSACIETESSTTTTVAAGVPIDLNDYPIPPDTVCFYLAGWVGIPADQVAAAEAALVSGGVAASQAGAGDVLNDTTSPDEDISDDLGDVAGHLGLAVGFLQVTDDPLQVSLALRDLGYEASPINVVGFSGHIRFQPGTDPSPVAGLELPDVTAPLDGQYVAVVDSGIVPPVTGGDPIPNWFHGADDKGTSYVLYDTVDEETLDPANPASHGTFIAGLIRQIAPSKRVTFAAARLIDTDKVISQGEELPSGLAPTAEIQVAEAMGRLMLRHQGEAAAMTALNLSLGTYGCGPVEDIDLVTMKAVSGQWLGTFQESEIMVAAGNENHQRPPGVGPGVFVEFWPAAFTAPAFGFRGRFNAVAAVDRIGGETVWADKAPVKVATPPGRPWVTDWAPGADLVSLAGGIYSDPTLGNIPALVCWSGSSFATAVASAQFALGKTPSPDYNSAEGLTFVKPNGGAASEVVTVGGSSSTTQACDHGEG